MYGFKTINGILVDVEILTEKFVCDLSACKGACCTLESEYGAPLEKSEIEIIEKIYPVVKKYLPEHSLQEIEKNGFWEYKSETYMTRSINNRDCVFVYYEGDVAKCAIEKAFLNGETDFKKPVSCHLFPVRVADFGGPILKYEKYGQCKPATEKGEKENVTVAAFLEEPLVRRFGKDFYEKLINSGE